MGRGCDVGTCIQSNESSDQLVVTGEGDGRGCNEVNYNLVGKGDDDGGTTWTN